MCRCSYRQSTDEQMCPTLATDSMQRLRKRRKTSPSSVFLLLLLVTLWANVNVVSGVCVWQGGGSFRLACGFRQSGLFRIRSLGGLKGYVGAGFTVGDEDGFKDSMTNTDGKTTQQQQQQQQQQQLLQQQQQYYGQQQRISTGHQSHVNFPHQLQGQYSEMDVEKVNGKDYHRSNPNLIAHNANANVNQLSQAEVLALQQQQTELLLLQQLQQQQQQMQKYKDPAKSVIPAAQLMAPTSTSSPHNDDPSRNGLTKRASLWRWPKLPIFGGSNKDNRNNKNPHRGKTGRGPPLRQGPIYDQQQHNQQHNPQHNQHHNPQHNQHHNPQHNQHHNPQNIHGPPQRGPGPRRPNSQAPYEKGQQFHAGGKFQRPQGGFPQRGPSQQHQGPVNYRRGPAASYSNNVNSISPSIPGPMSFPPQQQSESQYSSMHAMKRPHKNQFGFGGDEGNLPEFKGIPNEYFDQNADYNEQDQNAPEEDEQQYLEQEEKPYGLKMLQNTNNYGAAFQLMDSQQPKVPPYLDEAGSENIQNPYENTQGMDPGFGALSGYDMNDPALATAGYDPNIFPDIYFTTTEKENDKHIHRVLNGQYSDPTAHLEEPSVIEQEVEPVIEEAVVEKPKIKRIRIIKGGKRRKKKRRRKLRVNNATLNALDVVTNEPESNSPQVSEQIPEESTTSKQVTTTSAETTTTTKAASTEMATAASSSTERIEPAPASLPLTSTSPDYGSNFVDERYLPFNIESYYYEESKHEVPPPPPPPKPPTKYRNDWLTKTEGSFQPAPSPSFTTPDPSSGYDPRYPPNHEINRGKIPTKFLRSTTTTTTPRPFFREDTHYNPTNHFNKTRFMHPNRISTATERSDALQFVPFGSGENQNQYDKTRLYNDQFYSHFNKSTPQVTGNFYSNPGYYNPQFSFDTDNNGKLRGIVTSPRPPPFGPPSDFNPEEIILPWEKNNAEPTPIIMNLNGGKNRMKRPPGPVFPGSSTMDIDQDPGFVKPNLNLEIFNSPTMETFGLPRKPTPPPNRFKYPDESEERSDTFTINELRKKALSDIGNAGNSESESHPNFWGKIQELDRFGPSSDFVTNDNFKVPVDRVLSTESPSTPQPPTTPSPSISTTTSSSGTRWTKSRRRMRTKPTTTTTTEMPPVESPINAATMLPPKDSPSPWNNFEDNGQVFSGLGVQVKSKDVSIAQSVSDEGLWAGNSQKLPVLTTNEDKTIFQLHNSDHQENMYVGNMMSSTTLAPSTSVHPSADATKRPKWRRRKPGSAPNVRIKFKGASAEQQDKSAEEAAEKQENSNSFSQNFFDMNSVTSENSVDSVNNPNPFAKFENVEVNSGSSNSGEGFVSKNEFLDIASTIKKLTKQNKKKFSQNVHVDSSEEKSQSTGEGEGSISPAPHPGKLPSNIPNIVPSPPDPFQYENSHGQRFNFPSQSFAPPQPPSPSQSHNNQYNKPWGIPTAKYEPPSLLSFHSTTSSSFPRKPVDLNTIDYSTSTENSRQIKVEENHLEYPGPGIRHHHSGMGDLHDEIDSLNQDLENLVSLRSTTRRPIGHHYNNNNNNNNGFKQMALPDAVPVQNMFPPPPLIPPPFAMDHGPSIKIIKPSSYDDTRGSESEPNRYEKIIPSQKFKGMTTPAPPKPTSAPAKTSYFDHLSPGKHYDGSKKNPVTNDEKGNKNNNALKDKEKKTEFGSVPMKESKAPSLDKINSNNNNNQQKQKSPSNINQGHFGQSVPNFSNGNSFGNQNMLSTMTSIMANSNVRYGGNNGPNSGINKFNGGNQTPNGGNHGSNNGNHGSNNGNHDSNDGNHGSNSGNHASNSGNKFNSENHAPNSGNNFNNGNHAVNSGNNFNGGNYAHNFNGPNHAHNFNGGNHGSNGGNQGQNGGNNFNGGNKNNFNNENNNNGNNNNFNNGNKNQFHNENNNNGNNNNFNNGNKNNFHNENNNNNGNNNNFNNNGGNNNNFAAAASNYFSNGANDLRRPGLGPLPTQIPHQTFQPPMPMPPPGIPTMGSLLAPFSNMLTNTFGIGKHKPPPPYNMQMLPPMMNPQQPPPNQQQQRPPPNHPPHMPPPPQTTKFPPPNKFNNINLFNNRFPPPPPINQMNNQFNHPFQKPPHPNYREGPPKHHPFNRPTMTDGDPMHMMEQQSHSQMKNVPPMMPMPMPIRRPQQPQPPSPPKKKPLNDKEKIIEALETLNSVKYDEIESVAAEQFGPDLIERIKSKKKLSVPSTTATPPRPTTRYPSSTTPRPTQRPYIQTFSSTTMKTPSVSDSSVQLASLISYVNKMKKENEKLKNINQAIADAHSSESKNSYSKNQSPVASMSTDDISSLFASMSSMERGSKTATKHSTTTTTTPKPKTMKPAIELPVFGPTSASFSYGGTGGDANDIKTLQSQLAKAILAKAARQQENKSVNPSPTAPQKLIAAAPALQSPLQAVVHLASLKGNHLGINSKNYTSAQIETLKKLIALNNIEKKLMQSHGLFNLSSAISGRGPQQSPWRPPQQPTPFHNKMLLDHSSSPNVNHLDFSSNSPVQNNPFSASANNNNFNNNNNKVTSHIKLINSNNNNNNQFQNNFAAPVPSPSDPTLVALKALAMKKAQGINPQPNIQLPQQTKPKEEKSAGGFQPIPVDLSAILSPSPPLEVAQPEGKNWQRRTRLTDIKNAPKSFYPGNASLEFDASSSTQMFTDFSCDDQKFFPGLYADTALSCKVFHLCAKTNTGYMMKTFRCPRETVFDQEVLRCNWNLYVECNESQDKYHFNKYLSQSFQFLRILGEFSASYQKPNATVTG